MTRPGRVGPAAVELAGEQLEPLAGELGVGERPGRTYPGADLVAVTLGQQVADVSLLVAMAAMDERVFAEDALDRAPSITDKIACSGSRPRSTRSESNAVATVAFWVEASQSPSGILTPSVVIPSATTWFAA